MGFKYRHGFRLFLEEVQNQNSDKEVRLRDHQEKLDEYNSKKGQLQSIINGRKPEQWEEEAAKVIDGNPYLGFQWKINKIEYEIKSNEEKVRAGNISQEEAAKIKDKIKADTAELNKARSEVTKKINDDLADIKTM
jgi:hypothetical protein